MNEKKIDEISFKLGELNNGMKEAFKRFDKIEKQNGRILESIQDINNTCIHRGHQIEETKDDIDDLKDTVNTLEEKGETELSRNSKLQILANAFISLVNIIITAITSIFG